MGKRHSDAIAIQIGAVNPSGIVLAIVAACQEIRNDPQHFGTKQITTDPAVRLMVHQLAYICGIISGAEEFANKPDYHDCTEACGAAIKAKADAVDAAKAETR